MQGGEISKINETNEEIDYHESLLKNLLNMKGLITNSSANNDTNEIQWIENQIQYHEEQLRRLRGEK